MKEIKITKNTYLNSIRFYFSPKFIIFFYLIKFCTPSCDINTPFLKNEVCTSSCSIQEIKNEVCKIENEIYKTQWINNINYISSSIYTYVNIKTTQNGDLIILISSYEIPAKRLIYRMTKEGRGYFTINNEENKILEFSISSTDLKRYESEIFMAKLSTNTQKEYLISFGHMPNTIELYDLEKTNVLISYYKDVFYDILSINQLRGAYTNLTTNDYIIGLNGKEFNSRGEVSRYKLCLLKFNIILDRYNSPKINYNNIKSEITTSFSNYASCYTTSSNFIICFYKNTNYQYTMQAFTSSLGQKEKATLGDGNKNENIFFKCIHFFGDIGAFIFFNKTPIYPIIQFKKYSSGISSYSSIISLNDYPLFFYNGTFNDFIKVSDKKVIYVTISLDKLDLYIISIINYHQEKLAIKIYKTNAITKNSYSFYMGMQISIYNNYLALVSNGYYNSKLWSTLIIFSYPSNTDINNEISKYLFNYNDIKIDNITLEIQNLCNIENNIFGYILTKLTILQIYKTSNHYLYKLNNFEEIKKDMNLTMDQILKLKIEKNNNGFYDTFLYGIKYTCLATEPEFEEYKKYTKDYIDTGTSQKEDYFFDSFKSTYYGRYTYYNFSLDIKLIDEGCDGQCELCYYTEKNKCITCRGDYEVLDGNKICSEEIITTIPKIETTLPIIETTIPEIETTIPILETTIPEIETTLPILETTIPEIETILPILETTIPEIETTIPIIETSSIKRETNCSFEDIIQKFCYGELTDEMSEDIYLYIKNHLITENTIENNIIVKTPSVAFQLTSLDEQKKNNNMSIIDLGECENKLKEEYNISKEESLIIFKIDIQNKNKSLTYVQYEVYNPNNLEELDLKVCQNLPINISVPANLSSETITLYENLKKSGYNLFNSKDKFYNDICTAYTSINNTDILLIDRQKDIYEKFGNLEICQENCELQSYHSESTMVSCSCDIQSNKTNLDLYIQQKFSIKSISGLFLNYLKSSNFRVLKCYQVAIDLNTIFKNRGRIIMSVIFFIFFILFIIYLIKGSIQIRTYLKQIMTRKMNSEQKTQLNNKAKTKKKLETVNLIEKTKGKNKNKNKKKFKINSNPIKSSKIKLRNKNSTKNNLKQSNLSIKKKYPKNLTMPFKVDASNNRTNSLEKKSLINSNNIIKKERAKLNKNKKNNILVYNVINHFNYTKKIEKQIKKEKDIKKRNIISLNDQELNSLDYKNALILDKRTYFQYYISLLKKKHLIIFTFIPMNDYNLYYIKIILFLLTFSLYLNINGFFFGDDKIHSIYANNGLVNYLNQIVSIIFSSIIPSIINIILKQLALSENSILKLKGEKDIKRAMKISKGIEKCLKIRLVIFFILCFLFLLFFWYFISCFCGVYLNTQMALIIDTLISFGISMTYPFGLNLIPGIFRISALRAKKKDKKGLFLIGKLLAII